VKYGFIASQQPEYPVRVQGFVLKVSESGYYQWRKRKPCPSDLEAKQQLEKQVTQVFYASHQTYGSPRVRAALVQKGCGVRVEK
jgi:putative transposase